MDKKIFIYRGGEVTLRETAHWHNASAEVFLARFSPLKRVDRVLSGTPKKAEKTFLRVLPYDFLDTLRRKNFLKFPSFVFITGYMKGIKDTCFKRRIDCFTTLCSDGRKPDFSRRQRCIFYRQAYAKYLIKKAA